MSPSPSMKDVFLLLKQFRIRVNVQLIMHVQIRKRTEDEAEFCSPS